MARPLRIQYPEAIYHVRNRGTARQRVFRGVSDYQRFLDTLAEVHTRWGVEVFAYCLVGTHYDLCLRTPEGNLARIMRHVDGLYTQRFNRAHGRTGPLFRGRYQAILLEADAYLTAVVRYIHQHPVAAGLVATPEEYSWSSHQYYLSPRNAPGWLEMEGILRPFGGSKDFHHFVVVEDDANLERFYRRRRQSPILGGERFRAWVLGKVKVLDREHPRQQRRLVRPTETVVFARVAEEYGVPVNTLRKRRRGWANQPRKVAMYLVHHLCDLTLKETRTRFDMGSYGGVGWACSQVRGRLTSDKEFRRRIERLERRIRQQKT